MGELGEGIVLNFCCGSGTLMWAALQAGAAFVVGLELNPRMAEGSVRNLEAVGYKQGVDFAVVVADAREPFDLDAIDTVPKVRTNTRWDERKRRSVRRSMKTAGLVHTAGQVQVLAPWLNVPSGPDFSCCAHSGPCRVGAWERWSPRPRSD